MFFALYNEQQVTAADAVSENSYIFEYCDQPAFLKRGMVRQPHFAHYKNVNAIECEKRDTIRKKQYDAEKAKAASKEKKAAIGAEGIYCCTSTRRHIWSSTR